MDLSALGETHSCRLSLYIKLYYLGLFRIDCDVSSVYTLSRLIDNEIVILLFMRQVNWIRSQFVIVILIVFVVHDVEQVV